MKYKDPNTGMYKDLYFKTGDTLPVGTIVEYDGEEVPPGYKEVPGTVASVVISPTEPETGEEVWIQKGKNLFNINGNVNVQGNSGSQTSYNSVSGNVLTASQNTSLAHGVGQKFTNLKGKTFTCSAKVVSAGTGNGGLLSIYEDGSEIKKVYINVNEVGEITYTGKSDNIVIAFATQQGINAQFTDIQVELSDVMTSYEPYIDKKIYIKNNNGVYEEFYDETNLEVYSTEEQRIGTWIDGKPLYRKVVHSTDTTNMTVLAHVSDNLDMLYVESGYLYRPDDGLYRGLDYSNCYKYGDNSHSVYLTKGGENWVNFEVYATVCYTKTTD